MIYNFWDTFSRERSISQIVERRLRILAEGLPFDPQRIKAWAFCKTALSIAWTVEDHGTVPELELEVLLAVDGVSKFPCT
jgi:streptomycin 6-kinase